MIELEIGGGRPLCRNLILSYSLTCNARCAHCEVRSSPEQRGKLGVGTAKQCIEVAARSGVKIVGITGGEPTVYLDDLLEIMRSSHEEHGTVFAMTTNGSWGKSAQAATEVVARLADAGLKHLRLSADAYHQAFVPLAWVTHAVEASLARGLRTRVEVVVSRSHPESQAIWRHFRRYPVELSTQDLVPRGRALESFSADSFATASAAAVRRQPCALAGQLTVDHEGGTWLCCNSARPGAPEQAGRSLLWLGSLQGEPFADLFERNARSLLARILHLHGPERLRRLVSDRFPDVEWPVCERYHSLCALCQTLVAPGPAAERTAETLRHLEKEGAAA